MSAENARSSAENDVLAYVQSRVPNFTVSEHSDLVTALCDRVVRAWDEGYKTGYSYRGPHGKGAGNPVPANPYRQDAPRGLCIICQTHNGHAPDCRASEVKFPHTMSVLPPAKTERGQ